MGFSMKNILTLIFVSIFASNLSFAQSDKIRGSVKDEFGQPFAQVTVFVKSSQNRYALTNNAGEYEVKANEGETLVFSYIGMVTVEKTVGSSSVIDVVMKADNIEMEETVVIAYGTMKKRDLTGSVSSFKAKDSEKTGIASIDDMLKGRIAGVDISGNNSPGGSKKITIRGASSISASTQPLYVIDGIPILNGGTSAGAGVGSISNIANIDPNSVASIEVLKDASSTAIYGSQGANGVILITTKKAESGVLSIDFSANLVGSVMQDNYKMMDSYDYAYYVRNAITNTYPAYHDRVPTDPNAWGSRFYYLDNWKNAPSTNWLDIITRPAFFQEYNLSMRGGSDKVKTSASASYLDNSGVVDMTNFKRYAGDLRTDFTPSKHLSFFLATKLSHINNDGVITSSTPDQAAIPTSAVMSALSYDPTVIYEKGNMEQYFLLPDGNKLVSPYANLAAQQRNSKRFDGWLSGGVSVDVSDFKLQSNFSGRYEGIKNNSFDSKWSQAGKDWGGPNGGIAEVQNYTNTHVIWTNMLHYNKVVKKNRINAMLAHEYQKNYSENQYQKSIDFPIDLLGPYNIGMADPEGHSVPVTGATEWVMLSFFGRLNYSYDSRYLFTGTFRSDGSSRFAKNHKWGYFPSGAFAWVASSEKFMKSATFIDLLKFRVSWGVTGNQSISPYQSQALMGSFPVYSNGGNKIMALRPDRIANDDLKWESTSQTNIGVDMAFFKSRLSVTVDLYKKETKDLLMNLNIPPSSGFSSIISNVGSISNKGIEVQIASTNIANNNFSWMTNFNIAFNKNRVDDLGGIDYILSGKSSYQRIIKEGEPLDCWYGLQTDGLWTQDDITFTRDKNGTVTYYIIPGRERPTIQGEALRYGSLKFKDISGKNGVPDNVINDYDRAIIGRSQPIFFGGFTNTFSIKNFTINLFMDYSYGNQVFNQMKQQYVGCTEAYNHYSVDYYFPTIYKLKDRGDGLLVEDKTNIISNGNPNGKYPINAAATAGLGGYTLDMFIEDASYLRIKELSVTYSVPSNLLKKISINRLQVMLKTTNLYTFTNYSGNDPTVVTTSDWNPYPASRTYQLGLNFNF